MYLISCLIIPYNKYKKNLKKYRGASNELVEKSKGRTH